VGFQGQQVSTASDATDSARRGELSQPGRGSPRLPIALAEVVDQVRIGACQSFDFLTAVAAA